MEPTARENGWERALRTKLAFLCMAAVAGKEGDMRALTDDILYFARNLSGAALPTGDKAGGENG